MQRLKERLMAGEHLVMAGETLRYDLFYENGLFWLRRGNAPSEPFATVQALAGEVLLALGTWEPESGAQHG